MKLRSNLGIGLLEVLVALALLGMAVKFYLDAYHQSFRGQRASSTQAALDGVEEEIVAVLHHRVGAYLRKVSGRGCQADWPSLAGRLALPLSPNGKAFLPSGIGLALFNPAIQALQHADIGGEALHALSNCERYSTLSSSGTGGDLRATTAYHFCTIFAFQPESPVQVPAQSRPAFGEFSFVFYDLNTSAPLKCSELATDRRPSVIMSYLFYRLYWKGTGGYQFHQGYLVKGLDDYSRDPESALDGISAFQDGDFR